MKDLPEEVVNEMFDRVKITARKSIGCAQLGVGRILLSGSAIPKLPFAVGKGDKEEVKRLLSCGADVNQRSVHLQNTALSYAVGWGHIDIVKLFLGRPELQLDCTGSKGNSVLHDACFYNRPEMIFLICQDKRCTTKLINQKNGSGESCLLLAADKGHVECMEELAKVKGVYWNTKNSHGDSLIQAAKKNRNERVIKFLEKKETEARAVNLGKIAAALVREKTYIKRKEEEIKDLKAIQKNMNMEHEKAVAVAMEEVDEINDLKAVYKKSILEQDQAIEMLMEEVEYRNDVKANYNKRIRDQDWEITMTMENEENRSLKKMKMMAANQEEIDVKESEKAIHESVAGDMRSELLQSLTVLDEVIPECPSCTEQMKPPVNIFNCPNGHLICSDCKPNVPKNLCIECRTPYAGRANGMEKIIRNLVIP